MFFNKNKRDPQLEALNLAVNESFQLYNRLQDHLSSIHADVGANINYPMYQQDQYKKLLSSFKDFEGEKDPQVRKEKKQLFNAEKEKLRSEMEKVYRDSASFQDKDDKSFEGGKRQAFRGNSFLELANSVQKLFDTISTEKNAYALYGLDPAADDLTSRFKKYMLVEQADCNLLQRFLESVKKVEGLLDQVKRKMPNIASSKDDETARIYNQAEFLIRKQGGMSPKFSDLATQVLKNLREFFIPGAEAFGGTMTYHIQPLITLYDYLQNSLAELKSRPELVEEKGQGVEFKGPGGSN